MNLLSYLSVVQTSDIFSWVLVEAKDLGNPPKSSELNLTCQVLDINEFKPVFDNSSYSAEVRTTLPVGGQIVSVRAIDRDRSGNEVTYSLEGSLFAFSINSIDGMISSALPLTVRKQYIQFVLLISLVMVCRSDCIY